MSGIKNLTNRYPSLITCKNEIEEAFNILRDCLKNGHKILVAGNGGSSADADHIVGELMKKFKKNRPISEDLKKELIRINSEKGSVLAEKLQLGLPAISLANHQALNTATINDIENGGDYIFAEQVLNYGQKGDVLLVLSTSGNSKNVLYATVVARAKGIKVVGMTGENGGELSLSSDVCIKVPEKETYLVQELHVPVYHYLCMMLEEFFF